jgi:hypothetical protein
MYMKNDIFNEICISLTDMYATFNDLLLNKRLNFWPHYLGFILYIWELFLLCFL